MNTIGQMFRVTTFGESHGAAVGGIIDGCPPNWQLDIEAVNRELTRRSVGDALPISVPISTPRREDDRAEWLSGLNGTTVMGTPLAFLLRNRYAKSSDYNSLKDLLRPGHGDYTWSQRYPAIDTTGGSRYSARETAARVVAGAVARQWLARQGIGIQGSMLNIGTFTLPCHNNQLLDAYIKQIMTQGNTVGGSIKCTISGLDVGIGEPVFDKLNSKLASAMFTIPSVAAFEMGVGTKAATMTGSEYVDQWLNSRNNNAQPHLSTATNHCGGVQAGLSNGMNIEFTVSFHPIATRQQGMVCASKTDGSLHCVNNRGRHDICQIPRAVVVVEAMAAITIADLLLIRTAYGSLC